MKRHWLNLLVDIITTVAALGLVATGFLIHWILPAGSGRSGSVVWSMDRHEWGEVHFWFAVTVVALVVVHVFLHWDWVCMMFARMFREGDGRVTRWKANLAGVLAVVIVAGLIGGFLWLAASVKTTDPDKIHDEGRGAGQGQGRGGGWGRMLLDDEGDFDQRPRRGRGGSDFNSQTPLPQVGQKQGGGDD